MSVKQSFCYSLFKPADMPAHAVFTAAKQHGYAAYEFWDPAWEPDITETLSYSKKFGMAIASMGGHGTLEDGVCNPASHPRIEDELRRNIELAAAHSIKGLIILSGNRLDGQTDEDAVAVIARILGRMAPHAERKGVNLNLELLNSKIDHPGYICDHFAFGKAVCDAVKSDRVKLLYDIYHMQIMEGDVIRTITANISYIGHFHTAGNPGRRDLDSDQEINYAAVCRAIDKAGYDLYVGHEFAPKGERLAALKSAFDACHAE